MRLCSRVRVAVLTCTARIGIEVMKQRGVRDRGEDNSDPHKKADKRQQQLD